MTEASEPKRRSFADGIKFGRYLERTGLIDYRPLRLRYEAGLRKGEFSGLWAYWDSQPWLMRLGKTLIRQEIFREKDNPFYPFPSQDDFEGEITLGAINPNGGLFRFSHHILPRNFLVVGSIGTGKSNAVKELIRNINDNTEARFWIFDAKREYRRLSGHLPRLKVVRVSNFWDNPFEKPSRRMEDRDWAGCVSQIFEVELGVRLASQIKLFGAWDAIVRERGNEVDEAPTCVDLLYKLKELQKAEKSSYDKSAYRPLIERFEHLKRQGRYFTTPRSIPVADLLDQNIVFEFDTVAQEFYGLVMGLLIAKAFFLRMYEPENVTHYHVNVVEEARVPFDARRDNNPETKGATLGRLISQYREFKGCFITITQEPSSISQTPKANAHIMLAMPVSHGKELLEVKRAMVLSHEQMDYYRELPLGYAVASMGGMKPFLVKIPKFSENRTSLIDKGLAQETEGFLNRYREKCGWGRLEEQDMKAEAKHEAGVPGVKPEAGRRQLLSGDALKVLFVLGERPFLKYTELKDACDWGASKLGRVCKWLCEYGYLTETKIKTCHKSAKYMVLTDRACQELEFKKPKGKGSFQSKLFSEIIRSHLAKQGWEAEIEGRVPGGGKAVDVLAGRKGEPWVAYEVTLSTDNIMENIEKDLATQGVERVVLVFENEKTLNRVMSTLRKKDSDVDLERVEYVTIKSFCG